MKQKLHILFFFFGILVVPQINYAQVDFNKRPDDDLGNNEDEFQEVFYEALKQKSIENYDRAAEGFQKCIALNKTIPVLYFELGKSYFKLKNYSAAEDALKKAVALEPDNEWFLDELYGFYAEQNDLDNAIKTVKQLVNHHPDYKEDLASLYVQTKKYDEALQLLDALDSEYGVSIPRDRLRNIAYEATGRKTEQIENLESRVENNPNKESNYLALIFRYSENNEKEKAFETAKELLKTNPNSQLVHLALYKFYLDNNDTDKAIASMKTVVQSTQIKPEAKAKVLADFVNFVKTNPQYEADLLEATTMVTQEDNEKSLLEMGQYYLSKNDKQKALEYFQKAFTQDGNNFSVLKNILLLQIDLQDYKQAEKGSADALEKYPSQPLLYLINGVAHNNLNEPNKAIDALEIGLDYIIDDTKMEANFYNQLSQAYTLLNNTEKAKTFSEKAQKLKN
jgi:tetratricopeptide (TPR) repeat protein